MNEGLEKLKEIHELVTYPLTESSIVKIKDNIAIIEKELKRLYQVEIMYSNCVIEGAKQKKALDIIKAINLFSVYESIEGKYYLETNIVEMELMKENYKSFKGALL